MPSLIGILCFLVSVVWTPTSAKGQAADTTHIADTISYVPDTVRLVSDSLSDKPVIVRTHKEEKKLKAAGIPTQFVPDPQRALWLALVCPGAGQIYNRKYWKLPIFYGGFLGCVYAFTWNQQQFMDYSQAYLDLMDDNPNTKSYMNMFPEGFDITGRESQYQSIFKRRKDYFRRNRDISLFCFIGVYLLSVVDAYVDAGLSVFDISTDLSLHLQPAVINQRYKLGPKNNDAYGMGLALSF